MALRLLTTGGGGQLGRSIASVVADRKTVEAVFPDRAELDISDSAAIAAAIDRYAPDAVINCAAYTAVDNAEDNEAEAFAINAAAAGSLAAACAHAAVPLIHISTDYVFDGAKTAPYSESDPTCPVSVYGRSKLEGERRVAAAAPRHVILRTAWVHSEYGANFVKTMLRLAADRDTVSVVADQYGSPTYAPHLAAAIVAGAAAYGGALLKPGKVVDLIAEAFAFSDQCRNYSVDSDRLTEFLSAQDMRIDDRYRSLMAEAMPRQKRAATKVAPREACSKAIENFGENGRSVQGLISPRH